MIKRALTSNNSRLTSLSVALLVGLAAVALLPPGRLPYRADSLFSDATIAHWPNALFLRESVWQYGQWPLWRPTEMLGAPFAANPLSKVWYPPQWLVLVPGLPVTLTLNVLVYAHLIFGALGMLAWARAEELPEKAGAFAALAYGLTPKVIAHLGAGHLDLIYAAGWVPWWLWAVRRYAQRPWTAGGLTLGTIGALMALADVRLAAYALAAGAVYALSLSWKPHALGLGALVFCLLMAVCLTPLLALKSALTRAAITPAEAASYSLPPRYLLGLVLADTGGLHEWMTYLGLPALGLAILALRTRRREVWLWWGIVVLAVIYALGEHTPFYPTLVRIISPLTWLRIPSRAWFVVALGIACLSAYGAQSLLNEGLRRAGRLASTGVAVAGLAMSAGALVIGQPQLVGLGLALLGTGAGLLLAAWKRVGVRWSLVALGSVLVVSLMALDVTLVEGRREAEVFDADTPSLAEWGRVYSPSFSVLPHEAERANLLTLHGVNPFQLTWSAEAINAAAGMTGGGYSIISPSLPPGQSPSTPDVDLLAALSVQQVISDFPVEIDGPREIASALYTYEVTEARPMAYLTESDAPLDALPLAQGHAEIDALTPNRVTIETDASDSTLLVVTQAWAPGWRARVDGQPAKVTRAGGAIQGVRVPAGSHRVELTYCPTADFVGIGISAATTIVLAARELNRWRRSR